MSLQGPLPVNCAAHTRAGESLKHASTHGGGAGEERQAAFDSFKDRSITKQTTSENRIGGLVTGESTRSHTSELVPLSVLEKHQTDLTPAPEPMFQPVILEQGMERPRDNVVPGR